MTIFLSHSKIDNAVVLGLVSHIAASGRTVWIDENNLVGGELWWPEILNQIRTCEVFVFAVSDHSLKSNACKEEFDYARALGRPVLPVQIGDMPDAEALLHPVFSGQVVDYRHPTAETAIALTRALSERERATHSLPEPLPPEPETPFLYLLELGRTIRGSADISPADQESIFRQLSRALEREENASAHASIISLVSSFSARDDITVRTKKLLESMSGLTRIEVSETPPETQRKKTPETLPVPPGWYEDPDDSRYRRYWDGNKWAGEKRPVADESSLFSTLGIISGLVSVVPWVWGIGFIALIFGIIAVARHQRRGVAALVISILGPILGFSLWVALVLATTNTTS